MDNQRISIFFFFFFVKRWCLLKFVIECNTIECTQFLSVKVSKFFGEKIASIINIDYNIRRYLLFMLLTHCLRNKHGPFIQKYIIALKKFYNFVKVYSIFLLIQDIKRKSYIDFQLFIQSKIHYSVHVWCEKVEVYNCTVSHAGFAVFCAKWGDFTLLDAFQFKGMQYVYKKEWLSLDDMEFFFFFIKIKLSTPSVISF